jgi:hypothetical protein
LFFRPTFWYHLHWLFSTIYVTVPTNFQLHSWDPSILRLLTAKITYSHKYKSISSKIWRNETITIDNDIRIWFIQ